jgi:predicted transcriptional regulator
MLLNITTTISGNEYRLTRLLRALGNENRLLIFKNLQNGQCYATELSNALKISRPALGKHVRVLIGEKLAEQNHVVENGSAKAIYELTDFGEKIAVKINALTEDIEAITNQIVNELHSECMDVNAQINSSNKVLKDIKKKLKNKEISYQDYEYLKKDYEKKIKELKKRRDELNNKLES